MAPGVLAGAEKVVLTGLASLLELGLNPLIIIIRETRSPKTAEEFQKALPPLIESKIIDSNMKNKNHLSSKDFIIQTSIAVACSNISIF